MLFCVVSLTTRNASRPATWRQWTYAHSCPPARFAGTARLPRVTTCLCTCWQRCTLQRHFFGRRWVGWACLRLYSSFFMVSMDWSVGSTPGHILTDGKPPPHHATPYLPTVIPTSLPAAPRVWRICRAIRCSDTYHSDWRRCLRRGCRPACRCTTALRARIFVFARHAPHACGSRLAMIDGSLWTVTWLVYSCAGVYVRPPIDALPTCPTWHHTPTPAYNPTPPPPPTRYLDCIPCYTTIALAGA